MNNANFSFSIKIASRQYAQAKKESAAAKRAKIKKNKIKVLSFLTDIIYNTQGNAEKRSREMQKKPRIRQETAYTCVNTLERMCKDQTLETAAKHDCKRKEKKESHYTRLK